jgi:hypothetical protein
MPRPIPHYISNFNDKLRLFYGLTAIKSDTEMAKVVGVAVSTLSEWVHGSEDRPPEMVPALQMPNLVRALVVATEGRLSETHAYALWGGPKDAFARVLAGSPEHGFLQFIKRRPSQIAIGAIIEDSRRMSIVDDVVEIPDDAVWLKRHEGVAFELESKRDRCLTVLYECSTGWYPVVPGKRHDGVVRSIPERVPGKGNFTFSKSFDLYRFVFIETETSTPLQIRREPTALGGIPPDEFEAFQIVLADPRQTKSWRWAEKYIAIEPPPALEVRR